MKFFHYLTLSIAATRALAAPGQTSSQPSDSSFIDGLREFVAEHPHETALAALFSGVALTAQGLKFFQGFKDARGTSPISRPGLGTGKRNPQCDATDGGDSSSNKPGDKNPKDKKSQKKKNKKNDDDAAREEMTPDEIRQAYTEGFDRGRSGLAGPEDVHSHMKGYSAGHDNVIFFRDVDPDTMFRIFRIGFLESASDFARQVFLQGFEDGVKAMARARAKAKNVPFERTWQEYQVYLEGLWIGICLKRLDRKWMECNPYVWPSKAQERGWVRQCLEGGAEELKEEFRSQQARWTQPQPVDDNPQAETETQTGADTPPDQREGERNQFSAPGSAFQRSAVFQQHNGNGDGVDASSSTRGRWAGMVGDSLVKAGGILGAAKIGLDHLPGVLRFGKAFSS